MAEFWCIDFPKNLYWAAFLGLMRGDEVGDPTRLDRPPAALVLLSRERTSEEAADEAV